MTFAKTCLNALSLLAETQSQLVGHEWMRFAKAVLESPSLELLLLPPALVSLWFWFTSRLAHYLKEKLWSTIHSNLKTPSWVKDLIAASQTFLCKSTE